MGGVSAALPMLGRKVVVHMENVSVQGVGGLVTVEQASRLLGISISGVYKRITRQSIPVVKLGDRVLLRASDLQPSGGVRK